MGLERIGGLKQITRRLPSLEDALTPLSIYHWFAPPELARPDLRQRARALWILSWPFFAVVTVLLGIAVLIEPSTAARRATTVVAVGALIAVLHAISRTGRPVFASWILVIGLSVIITQRAWVTGGINAPVAAFYVLFILMAGVLLGARGGFATAAVCALGATLLTVGTALEWLTPRPGAASALGGFISVMLAIGLALLLQALVTPRPRREGLDVDAVHMVVGDMRSPMQVLISHLEVLRGHLTGENAKDVEAAIVGVRTLRRMTNSLLDVSRLEARRMPIRRSITDLSALAHDVVSAVRVDQPTYDIAIETHGDSVCNCDSELTRRIIENLVSNAMKASTIDRQVRVVISGSQERASISVTDEGPTVPAEQRSRIFEAYCSERPWSAAGDESSGLGLAFCRLAVEAQGGTIRIETGEPRGNAFVVELSRTGEVA
jgi:signal transduction histidine kinase